MKKLILCFQQVSRTRLTVYNFFPMLTILLVTLWLEILVFRKLTERQVDESSDAYDLAEMLSIMIPLGGMAGAFSLWISIPFKFHIVTLSLTLLMPVVFILGYAFGLYEDITALVCFALILITTCFFLVLRLIDHYMTIILGKNMNLLIMTMVILIWPGALGSFAIYSYIYGEGVSDSYVILITDWTVLCFLSLLWTIIHKKFYSKFPEQNIIALEELGMKEKHEDLVVNSQFCDFVQGNSYYLLSFSVISVFLFTEIFLSFALADHFEDNWELILFLKIGMAFFLFAGVTFSSSNIKKEDKLVGVFLVAFVIYFAVIYYGNQLIEDEDYEILGYLVKYSIPASIVYWLSMLYLRKHNKRFYQLMVPVLCMTAFIPLGVLYPLYESSVVSGQMFGIIVPILQVVGIFLFVLFWLAEVLATIQSHLQLMMKRFQLISSYELVQYVYSLTFLCASFVLIDTLIDQRAENWQTGLLVSSITICFLAAFCSLFLQRILLYDTYAEKYTLAEILLNKVPKLSEEEEKLQRKKRINQGLNILFYLTLILCLITVMFFNLDSALISTLVFLSVIGCAVLLLLTAGLLQIKFKLKHIGERWVSKFIGCFWVFLLVPMVVIFPLLLTSADSNEELELISFWAPGAIFLLIIGGVGSFSIFLNSIYKLLESEKLAKYCIEKLHSTLTSIGVKVDLELLRSVYDQYTHIGERRLNAVLNEKTFVAPVDYEGDDLRFSKEIYQIDAANKLIRKLSRKLTSMKSADLDEIGCFQFLLNLCKNKKPKRMKSIVIKEKSKENIAKHEIFTFKIDTPPNQSSESLQLSIQQEAEIVVEQEQEKEKEPEPVEIEFDLDNIPEIPVSLVEKTIIQEEEQFKLVQQDEDYKKIWLNIVFKLFAHGARYTDHPYMTQYDLRQFIRISGLSKRIPSNRCDLVYVAMTVEHSPAYTKKYFPRIDETAFREKLLPYIEKMLHPREDKRVFSDYIYPHLVTAVPKLRRIFIHTGDIKSIAEIEEEQEPIDKISEIPDIESMPEVDYISEEVMIIEESKELNRHSRSFITPNFEEKWYNKVALCLSSVVTKINNAMGACFFCLMSSLFPTTSDKKPTIISVTSPKKRTESPEWPEICDITTSSIASFLEEWKRSKNQFRQYKIECNTSNLAAIISHAIEIISYCFVAFSAEIEWNIAVTEDVSSEGSAENEYWIETYLVALGVVLIFVVMIVPVNKLVKLGRLGLKKDYTKAGFPHPQFFLEKIVNLLASTLYLTVISAIISVFSCGFDKDTEKWTLMRNQDLECYDGIYWLFFALGLISFMVYYPVSTILYPNILYQDKALDLKFSATFLILESQGKLLIAGVTVFFSREHFVWLHLSVTIAVCSVLAIIAFATRPCLVYQYNYWKVTAYFIPIWVSIAALVNYYTDETDFALLLLVIGTASIVFCLVLGYCCLYGCRRKRKKVVPLAIESPRDDKLK